MKGLVNASPQDLCHRIRTGAKGFGLADRVASPHRVSAGPEKADAWPDTNDLAALWNLLPLRRRGNSWEEKIQNLSDAYATQIAADSNSGPVLPKLPQLSRIALYIRFVEPGNKAAEPGVPNAHSTEADSVLDSLHTQVEDMQRIEKLTTQDLLTAFAAEVEANPLAAANLPVTNPEDWAVIHDLVMRLEPKTRSGSPRSSPLADASLPGRPAAEASFPSVNAASLVLATVAEFPGIVSKIRDSVSPSTLRASLEGWIAKNPSAEFENGEQMKAFKDAFNEILNAIGGALECPKCHAPARLSYWSERESFEFLHSDNSKHARSRRRLRPLILTEVISSKRVKPISN